MSGRVADLDNCPLLGINPDNEQADFAWRVVECDDPEAHLDEAFTSHEIYDMCRFTGKSNYTTKEERIALLIRQTARMERDYRHMDEQGYGTV